jgi:hypothetical protein
MFGFFSQLWSTDASIVFKRLLHDRLLNWPLIRFIIGQQIKKILKLKKKLKI